MATASSINAFASYGTQTNSLELDDQTSKNVTIPLELFDSMARCYYVQFSRPSIVSVGTTTDDLQC